MNYELKLEGNVKGVGNIHYVEAPFDQEMKLFEDNDLKLISGKQLAVARMQHGAQSSFSQNGSWIKEGDLYLPASLAGKAAIILLKDSLILDNPEAAVNAHGQGKEYLVNKDKANEILEKAQKGNKRYLLLQSTAKIPTDRFGEEAVPVFLFGKGAKDYGLFLGEKGIKAMPLSFDSDEQINKQSSAYANQLWLGSLGDDSGIDGSGRCFSYYDWARGVQLTAEGGRAEKPATKKLTDKVLAALKNTNAFEYKGTVYVPVKDKNITLKK
jgi:hypothetical protein